MNQSLLAQKAQGNEKLNTIMDSMSLCDPICILGQRQCVNMFNNLHSNFTFV